MPSSVISIPLISLAIAQSSAATITCFPARYVQVQDDGVEYDRVDCVRSRRTNPQCSARSYAIDKLQIGPLAYTSSGQVPRQGEFLGRFHLLIDRGTGAFLFVVVATKEDDPRWHNVKTFSGRCMNANKGLPL